jgi:hypothetical protein
MLILTLALSGCGGASGTPGNMPGSGTVYHFVPPTLNSTRMYTETITDNSNNTINVSFTDTVTAINADGTYVVSYQPSNPTAIVNGTNYGGPPETETFNASGQETATVYTNGALFTCTYDPHGIGPDFPLLVGQTWSLDFTYQCNAIAPLTYSQTGSVLDVESVTVSAGTYTALKLQSTVTWTDANGTTRTQTITNWRDVVTLVSVKQEISIAYSGSLPSNGYAVTREIQLMSTS